MNNTENTVTIPPHPRVDEPTMAESTSKTAAIVAVVEGYEILGELGRGGMGVVYRARQTAVNRIVALKMILAGGHAAETELDRFRTEAEAIGRIQHPNIVQIYEVGQHDGLPYFSLEFCPGGSLDRKLNASPMVPMEAARLIETLARAMQAAHDKGVIHRDLKPANVLLAEDGSPKITDFGLAKKLDDVGRTASGAILGTPSYMAPEQADGQTRNLSPACDVYALGVILYESLTGRPPFKATTTLDTILQVLGDEPVSPRQILPAIPRDLETICLKCLQKEPRKRYDSALSLADELRRFLNGEPILARPVGLVEQGWRWCRRKPLVAGLIAGVIVSILTGFLASLLFAFQAQASAKDAREAQEAAETNARRAEENATEARTERRRSDERAYLSDIRLAERLWHDGDLIRLRELVDGQRPERTGSIDLRGFEWFYLRNQCNALKAEHDGMLLSPNGKALLRFGERGQFVLEEAGSARPPIAIRVDGPIMAKLLFSPDQKSLLFVANDGHEGSRTLMRIAVPGATLLGKSPMQAFDTVGIALDPKTDQVIVWNQRELRILSATLDKEVLVVPLETAVLPDVSSHDNLAVSADGSTLVAAGHEEVIVVDLPATLKQRKLVERARRKASAPPIDWVAVSPDGNRIVTSEVGGYQLWALGTQKAVPLVAKQPEPHAHFEQGQFTRDGKRLILLGRDRQVFVLDAINGEVQFSVRFAFEPFYIRLMDDENVLMVCGRHGKVQLWNIQHEIESVWLTDTPAKGQAWTLGGTPDKTVVASFGYDRSVEVVNATRPAKLERTNLPREVFPGVLCGPGEIFVGKSGEGNLTVAQVETGGVRPEPHLIGFRGQLEELIAHPNGQTVYGLGRFGPHLGFAFTMIRGWEATTGKPTVSGFAPASERMESLQISPDGRYLVALATPSFDPELHAGYLWDARSGRFLGGLAKREMRLTACGFSSDSRSVVLGDPTGKLHWLSIPDLTVERTLPVVSGGIAAFAFSPDGQRIAIAGTDNSLRLWDPHRRQEVLVLKRDGKPIQKLMFSADGRRLISGPYRPEPNEFRDRLRLWDARSD